MKLNATPEYVSSDNPTGCCPKFDPNGWDAQDFHFKDKLFLRALTKPKDHVSVDMGEVIPKVFAAIEQAGAGDPDALIVLSRDVSAMQGEHFFSVTKPVPDCEMVRWSGDYLTKVFEGPYERALAWQESFIQELREQGHQPGNVYFFYTTCPKCAEAYGKNYVVAVAELAAAEGRATS